MKLNIKACKISKSMSYQNYVNTYNIFGKDPNLLTHMKNVNTFNNKILDMLLYNLQQNYMNNTISFSLNDCWYQFKFISICDKLAKFAQLIVNSPHEKYLEIKTIRYVEIEFL